MNTLSNKSVEITYSQNQFSCAMHELYIYAYIYYIYIYTHEMKMHDY